MDRKTILVLGGGVGGQAAANALACRLNRWHRIVLVDKERDFVFSPSFLWLIMGQRKTAGIQKPLPASLRREVELVEAEVLAIDPIKKAVETSSGPLKFDYLLISLGAELAPEKVQGFQEGALNLYSLDGCIQIQKALRSLTGERVIILVVSSPFKCPAAPYEAAFLIEDFFERKRKPAEVAVFTPEPFPMPTAGPRVGEALKGMLESRGVRFHPNHKVTGIDPQEKTVSFENGMKVNFDLLVGVPPHQAPKALRDSGLVNETGWIPVDRETLATKYEGVYAIGDAVSIPIAGGKSLPKAGVFAHAQAEVVAGNISSLLNGQDPTDRFDGKGWCAIEMGGGRSAFGSGDFYAEGAPQIDLYDPARYWHWGKVLFEKWWLAPSGPKREALRLAIKLGAKAKGIPVSL